MSAKLVVFMHSPYCRLPPPAARVTVEVSAGSTPVGVVNYFTHGRMYETGCAVEYTQTTFYCGQRPSMLGYGTTRSRFCLTIHPITYNRGAYIRFNWRLYKDRDNEVGLNSY